MPLRDHFRPPVNSKHRWDAVHGQWPGEIVRTLFDLLPPGFVAEPKIYHPAPFEVDVSMIEDDDSGEFASNPDEDGEGGIATLTATAPTLTVNADLSELDEYEVLVYDTERLRTLVAAIEIVSPANKDRPDTREQFNNKVAALLRQDVCVTIIDLVTIQQANLYVELLAHLGRTDPHLSDPPPILYAVTLRGRKPVKNGRKPGKNRGFLDAWYHTLAVGQPLPTVPVWLSPTQHINLPLEPSYQEVCRLLRIA